MTYTARWGPKGFLVSPSKVIPFEGFSTSYTLKADSENDTSGTAPTNTRGRELQPMTFQTTYLRALGADPEAQITEWESLLGKSYPLYIGNKRFGPTKMTLTSVDVSDVLLTNGGEFIRAVIKITLEEYSEGKSSKLSSGTVSGSASTATATSASASKAASTYEQTVARKKAEKQNAMQTTASKSDRAELQTGKAVALK